MLPQYTLQFRLRIRFTSERRTNLYRAYCVTISQENGETGIWTTFEPSADDFPTVYVLRLLIEPSIINLDLALGTSIVGFMR